MAVSKVFSGREMVCSVAATSSGTLTIFGALENAELTVDRPSIDVVHQNTSGWTERLPGIATWQLTSQHAYLSTAASVNEQDTLRNAVTAGTRLWFNFSPSTGTGGQNHRGHGYTTSYRIGGTQTAPVLHNFTIMGDGAITES